MDYRELPKDFEGYKARLLAQRGNYRGIDKIMHEAEQCANITTDEYLILCDIANERDVE